MNNALEWFGIAVDVRRECNTRETSIFTYETTPFVIFTSIFTGLPSLSVGALMSKVFRIDEITVKRDA